MGDDGLTRGAIRLFDRRGWNSLRRIHLTARDLHGNTLFDEKASHVFQIEDGLIRRFDIRR